jgi:hypothetical protein
MSYYILPKIINIKNVNPILETNIETYHYNPYISPSLFHYYYEIKKQINNYFRCDINLSLSDNFNDIIKIVNPYEYIYSKVPGFKFSVSKLKQKTNLFYELLEVINTMKLFEPFYTKNIKSLHITNENESIECIEMLREKYNDKFIHFKELHNEIFELIEIEPQKYDFLFFETRIDTINNYILSLIKFVMIILKTQETNGNCIIKIHDIFYKPIIDVLYLLSSIYDKVYILKPNTSNIITFEKYIICKNFSVNQENTYKLKIIYNKLKILINDNNNINKKIVSIYDFEMPYYFTIKLNDINVVLGQQQIESLNLIINILKNKNVEEKIQIMKKTCIQKCISWCEKHKIPFNKLSEKNNIFLPFTDENQETETELVSETEI